MTKIEHVEDARESGIEDGEAGRPPRSADWPAGLLRDTYLTYYRLGLEDWTWHFHRRGRP